MPYDVIIVGGRLAGAATGMLLAREGVRALEQVQQHLVDRLKILFEQSPLRHCLSPRVCSLGVPETPGTSLYRRNSYHVSRQRSECLFCRGFLRQFRSGSSAGHGDRLSPFLPSPPIVGEYLLSR